MNSCWSSAEGVWFSNGMMATDFTVGGRPPPAKP